MKTLKKGNTINKDDFGENSIELLTGTDVISSYDLNRPIKNLYENQAENTRFIQAILKGLYGNKTGIFKNILEGFSSTSAKAFALYNTSADVYFRVPTGVLIDKLSDTNFTNNEFTQDNFFSYGFINKPNTGLMERQLASMIALDLTEDDNDLSIEYDCKTGYYTTTCSIGYASGVETKVIPTPAKAASGTFSFTGTAATNYNVSITLGAINYPAVGITSGMSAANACTTVYNAILNTAGFTVTKPTTTSISIVYNTIGAVGNTLACTAVKLAPGVNDNLVISSPNSGTLTGGIDYIPITNTFELFNSFKDAYSGYNISNKSLEQKISLEPIFNISSIPSGIPYSVYYNRSNTKNFLNISATNTSVTDITGNFGLALTAPVGSFVIGTITKNSSSSYTYNKTNTSEILTDTVYPRNINAKNITAENIYSTNNFLIAQTGFLKKTNFNSRINGWTKIATFDPRQSFGTITVKINPEINIANGGSFTIDINAGKGSSPSYIIEGFSSASTITAVRCETSSDSLTGNVWVNSGSLSHSFELNLINSFNVILENEPARAVLSSVPVIATANIFERYINTPAQGATSDVVQFSFTNAEMNIVNPTTALKAISGTQTLRVSKDKISSSYGYTIGGVAKTAEITLKENTPTSTPTISLKGANVEISNYDANDTSNRWIKLSTGSTAGAEIIAPGTTGANPNAVGPAIMLDKDTVDISATNVHVWGAFSVHGENINFASANIIGKLDVQDTTAASDDGMAYSTKIAGGLYTVKNIVAATTIKALGGFTGLSYNALTLTANTNGFSIAGGATSKTASFKSGLYVGNDTVNTGDITLLSNGSANRMITLGGDLTTTNNISLVGHATGTTISVANTSLSFTSDISTVGSVMFTSSANTIAGLADVAIGNSLISGGVGVAPSWGKVGLTTHVSGILPIANGGTNNSSTPTQGGIAFGTGTAISYTALGTANQVLLSNGTGTPTWVNQNTLGAGTALALNASRTFTFTGDLGGTWTTDFSNSHNVANITVTDDAHNHNTQSIKSCKSLGNYRLTTAAVAATSTDTIDGGTALIPIQTEWTLDVGTSLSYKTITLYSGAFPSENVFINAALRNADYDIAGRLLRPKIDVLSTTTIKIWASSAPADNFHLAFTYMNMEV